MILLIFSVIVWRWKAKVQRSAHMRFSFGIEMRHLMLALHWSVFPSREAAQRVWLPALSCTGPDHGLEAQRFQHRIPAPLGLLPLPQELTVWHLVPLIILRHCDYSSFLFYKPCLNFSSVRFCSSCAAIAKETSKEREEEAPSSYQTHGFGPHRTLAQFLPEKRKWGHPRHQRYKLTAGRWNLAFIRHEE